EIVTKELVDDVYKTLQSRSKVLSIIGLAKEAQRNNVGDLLSEIRTPTLLVWGKNDIITPPEVAMDFHKRLPRSGVILLDDCGYAPMMEQPDLFNHHVRIFLEQGDRMSVNTVL
ncbi:MAG TPA: alpha/beta hydrolase, partial [Cyclobacteriaceae bacterium]|nr:alpha/beta hydrolase [Cyclobacteriaceae bacterium]